MRFVAWALMGWLATLLVSALAARVPTAHIMPNAVLVVVMFLAVRKEAPQTVTTAVILGHVVGTLALAPTGLHETALAIVALGAFLVSGNLSIGGSVFLGCMCLMGDVAYHILLVLLLIWQGHAVGFASWATAALLPQACLTGLCGWAMYHPFVRLDESLAPQREEGLQWR